MLVQHFVRRDPTLKNRPYGRANIQVSEIGVGGHREGVETRGGLDRTARFFRPARERAAVIGRAIEQGVNYFDTTFGCEIASLGESLRILGQRDNLFVSGMRVDFFGNLLADSMKVRPYTRREVEGRLREFGFDHIDQFMMGAIEAGDPLSHPKGMLEEAFEELEKLRDEGKVRFVGFSCHDPDYAARLLQAFPSFDSVMVPYNFLNRKAEGALSEAIRETRTAWIAMKTLVWRIYGIPVTALRHLCPVDGRLELDPSTPIGRYAHQFVLRNPLITTCVPAVNSLEAIDENVSASGANELTRGEEAELARFAEASQAEEMIPLAIAGLLSDNTRIRAMGISHIASKLKFEDTTIDWEREDADSQAERVAGALLNRLRKDARWAPLLP